MLHFETFTDIFIESDNNSERLASKDIELFHSIFDFYNIILKRESIRLAETIVCWMEYFEERSNTEFLFQQYLRAAKMLHNILFHEKRISSNPRSLSATQVYSIVHISSAIFIACLRNNLLDNPKFSELLQYCLSNMLTANEIFKLIFKPKECTNNTDCREHNFKKETIISLPRAAILNTQTSRGSSESLSSNRKEQVYANVRYVFKYSDSSHYEYRVMVAAPSDSNWIISKNEFMDIRNCPGLFLPFQEPNIALNTIWIDVHFDMGPQYKTVRQKIFLLIISIAERESNEDIKQEYLRKLEELDAIFP